MSLSRHASIDTMTLSRHISLDAMSVSRHISLVLQSDIEPIGSIIAFEGNPEIISTQLRLLPTSPQILILPSIQCYVPIDQLEHDFEAHTFIRSVVEAVKARNDTARAFLQGSTPTSKRLVFMNGGTPSAQALCIRAIMKHETEGDDIRAEAVFNLLVKDGVAGLENHGRDLKRTSDLSCVGEPAQKTAHQDHYHAKESNDARDEIDDDDDGEYQDPITRAMRAADALDRQTANLQPSNELDLTAPFRPRSMSLPLYGYSDSFNDAAPFFVFGGRQRAESEATIEEAVEEPYVPSAPNFAVTHYDEPTDNKALYPGFSDVAPPPPPKSPSCIGESYHRSTPSDNSVAPEFFTPMTDAFGPRSPDNVVYGEASLLDMRPSGSGRKTPIMRVRSLDRIYPDSPKFRDISVPADVDEEDPETPRAIRPRSFMVVADEKDPQTSRVNFIDGPRTVVVGPKKTSTITVAPVPTEKKRKPARTSYVDRGTDAEEVKESKEPFQPVLPFTEDLVVYFKDGAPDALLDAMVEAFKLGMYPVLPDSPSPSEDDEATETLRGTPEPHTILEVDETEGAGEPDVVRSSADVDEYDPFAYVQPPKPPPKPQRIPSVTVERPPTPARTPTPSVTIDKTEKFHDFKVSPNQTAVAVQNSLRSVLNVYFPREAQENNHFHFSLLPELEGLWKPIFREAEPGSPRKDNRKMDQILAIGSQKGVEKDFSAAITGQLEKLGTKSSGVTRSGRLDFRYLLANAMQAFTAQPLTSQTSDNPFNNSYLLATLIIPHLETYLALHSDVRYLLLEYPQEHLPTILALQKLVGVDLMKVAQILDSNSKKPHPFTHIRGRSISNNSSSSAASGSFSKPLPPSPRSSSDITTSKANFLLTSTASDSEIATFISTIWKILSEVSDFYAPVEPPKETASKDASKDASSSSEKIPRKPLKPASINTTLSAFPRTTAPQSPLSPVPPSDPPPMPAPALPAASSSQSQLSFPKISPSSSRAPSIAGTIRTIKSVKSKHSRTMSRASRRRQPVPGDNASVFTFDPAEDSDYDAEERRLMPIFMAKPRAARKPNSRKALKFLGLA